MTTHVRAMLVIMLVMLPLAVAREGTVVHMLFPRAVAREEAVAFMVMDMLMGAEAPRWRRRRRRLEVCKRHHPIGVMTAPPLDNEAGLPARRPMRRPRFMRSRILHTTPVYATGGALGLSVTRTELGLMRGQKLMVELLALVNFAYCMITVILIIGLMIFEPIRVSFC